jgi:HTH-type transcriptional regulator / antitoxin HigA
LGQILSFQSAFLTACESGGQDFVRGALIEILLADYDEANPPFGTSTPASMLAHVLEHRGLKQADLVPIVGSSAYVSQLISGKRGISRAMAKRLADFFQLKPELFLE